VPNVTIRDVTERPETLESGSNALAGANADDIGRMVALVTGQKVHWIPPTEYLAPVVAETVTRIVTSYRLPDGAEVEWMQGSRV
jgi:UDP-N-acetylglucosamine 2-epimerase (non-hydrolysing)